MEKDKIKGIIEAILFASGKVISINELALVLEMDQKEVTQIIEEMKNEYIEQKRGIELVNVNNGYTLSSKKELHEYIYPIIDKRVKLSLSQAALEVLAIIAYNPKITRQKQHTCLK